MKSTPVSIIIPAHNQAEMTRQCIASIVAHTAYPYHVYLVDNGSEEPLEKDYLDLDTVTVLRSDTNLGFAAGINLAMRAAQGHVLWLNNDTLVPEGWLSRMVDTLESADDIGAVGPMSNCVSGSQRIAALSLSSLDEINQYGVERRRDFGHRVRTVARLVGFCMLIHERAVREVGLLDESFATGNFEDDDYCVRLLRAGYRMVVDEGSFVFHYGSQTFHAMGIVGEAWTALVEQNQARFGAKWNLSPEDRVDTFQEAVAYNRAGLRCHGDGDLTGAIQAFVAGIRAEPCFARNHNDLAVVLWQHGEWDEAFERVKQALQVDPKYEDARANLADMAAALGRDSEAREIMDVIEKESGA